MKADITSLGFGLFCTNYDHHLSLYSIIFFKSVDLCCTGSSEILSCVHKVSFVMIHRTREATGHCLISLVFVLIYTARVFSLYWEPSSGAESARRCVRAASWLIPLALSQCGLLWWVNMTSDVMRWCQVSQSVGVCLWRRRAVIIIFIVFMYVARTRGYMSR